MLRLLLLRRLLLLLLLLLHSEGNGVFRSMPSVELPPDLLLPVVLLRQLPVLLLPDSEGNGVLR